MAEIQVYASFPRAVESPDLSVDPSNWRWIHCLTLPLETLSALQFSPKPYKWLRYAIGVIVGARGDLSSSPDSPNIVDYNAGVPPAPTVLYYHTSDEERQRMFPVDPHIGRTNVTSSLTTTRRGQFRDDVAERDGRECVLTGMEEKYCDAVHLLAHSKGDAYIATYTQRCSRDHEKGDVVQDIDSVQNGLFLNKFTHVTLGTDVAFLMTPNFAMNTSDIDATAPPAEKRCTAHLFRSDIPEKNFLSLGRETHPFGHPLRMSDSPKWPPAILFDAVYAGTVLHHFGTRTLKDEVATTWKDAFHSGGIMTAADVDYEAIARKRATAAERRTARYEARDGPDTFDMLLTLPYILVPRNELKAMLREKKEKAEATEQRRVEEKVDTWRKQITSA